MFLLRSTQILGQGNLTINTAQSDGILTKPMDRQVFIKVVIVEDKQHEFDEAVVERPCKSCLYLMTETRVVR